MKQSLKVAILSTSVVASVAFAADEVPRVTNVVVRADARFDFDQAVVRQEDQERILAELGKAGKVTWQSVNAVGYTDNVGTASYNQSLSERRANAVKAVLVSKGVDSNMIATVGKAAGDPVAGNDTPEGRAANRRTAIEFQGIRSGE